MEDDKELNEVEGADIGVDIAVDQHEENESSTSTADLRNASYFILFIAAVFVVNAMETGSYRTPWPVAILVSLAGLWLYGYSFFKMKDESDPS